VQTLLAARVPLRHHRQVIKRGGMGLSRTNSLLAAVAIGTVMLALSAPQSSAQQPAAANLGEAQVRAGGEWAIGRWEGNAVWLGTSSGTRGLTKRPLLLLIDKEGNGKVTCRLLAIPPPANPYPPSSAVRPADGLTKRCVIGPNGISLTTAISSEFELSRSGQDALQGPSKPPNAVGRQGPGEGGQVHMNRVR